MNTRFRFALVTSLISLAITLPLVWVVVANIYIFLEENTDNRIKIQTNKIIYELNSKLEKASQTANSVAHSLLALKQNEMAYPHLVSDILKANIVSNPEVFGIWTVWEPNTWNTPKDSVPLERLALYWNKLNGKILLDTLVSFNDPILGQYYLQPKKNRKLTILPPTNYSIGKKQVILSSIVYPIILSNDFQAVVGVDFNYDFFQSTLTKYSNYTSLSMAIYSSEGRVLAHSDRAKIGKLISIEDKDFYHDELDFLSKALKNNEKLKKSIYLKDQNEYVTVYLTPIEVPNLTTHFSILISERNDKLYADKQDLRSKIVFFIIIGFIVFYAIILLYINKLIKPFYLAVDYILSIANDNKIVTIKSKYKKLSDIRGNLFKSIESMYRSIKEKEQMIEEQNSVAEWIRVGQSKLYDSMRGIFSIKDMSENILFFLCKYLDIQIGALYLHYEKTKYLKLSAAYSLTYDDNINNYINIGEGLVGQAALDNRIVSIENVENQYFYSSSSTLKILPKNLIILPFSLNKKVIGVLEFGSYEVINGKKLKLLEGILENIAIALNSVMIANKISRHRRNKKYL